MKKYCIALIVNLLVCISTLPVLSGVPHGVAGVNITVITNSYTWPQAISTTGTYVCGTNFGGISPYLWSAGTGSISITGTPYGVSDNGKTAGTFTNSAVLYNGNSTETAGIWDHTTQQWTFLGMNPSVALFATDYNSGWDITADGLTVVGMQWLPGYNVSAFRWTNAGGYVDIGNGVGQGSRASGISSDGSVVFGWAQTSNAPRSPVIWYNSQVILVNAAQQGEAFGASTTGNYVTGTCGGQGFRWSPSATVFFSNTLNLGSINPVTVTNDGTVFGYTDTSWPPNPLMRRAFARDTAGVLMTFNDYAEARGLANAQQWTFYSVNDATADGKKLLGAGKNPEGQNVTFIMEFIDELPLIGTTPESVDFGDVPSGTTSPFTTVTIRNIGGGTLVLGDVTLGGNNASQFVLNDNNIYPVSLVYGDSITVEVAFAPSAAGLKSATLDISAGATSASVPLTGNGVAGVGLQEKSAGEIVIFPNPAQDQVTVSTNRNALLAEILDPAGKVVRSCLPASAKKFPLSLAGLPPGTYWFRVTGEGGQIAVRALLKK